MALFVRKKSALETLNEYCDEFTGHKPSEYTLNYLIENLNSDIELIKKIITVFSDHGESLDISREKIVMLAKKINDPGLFNEFLQLYINDIDIFNNNDIILKLLDIFNDKRIVVSVMYHLTHNNNILNNTGQEGLNILVDYLIEARQYYVDETALLSSFITLVSEIDPTLLKYGDTKKIKREINKKIIEDQKISGVYAVDQFTLGEIDRKLEQLGISSGKLSTLVETADNQIKILRDSLELNKSELNKAKIQELESLRAETLQIIKEFNAKYLELLNQERESLINEKDKIISDINGDIQERIITLNTLGETVAKRVTAEIARIRTASNDSITQMGAFLSNNENIKKMLSESKTQEELMIKLAKLDEFSANVSLGQNVIPIGISDESIPQFIIPKSKEITNPNYYFDESIPFKTRFAKLVEKKEQDIAENNAIYHEKFDDVLKMIIQNKTPYMYGPSGCGKTFMIEQQIAKLLGLNVTTNGYVLYEQDILGYTNSGNGVYVPSNFYRCFKMGNIIFFDELDNGIANATVVLNRFIGTKPGDPYVFPNGETVLRNPNFRIICAGNTNGSGKTLTYNTRQKMDESVMQRVTPIEINYDNRIEERILHNYPGWYNFVINFRKAVERIKNNTGEETNSVGTFTTRDAETVKKYLDDECFTDEQIMLYEIIENKDADYLNNILTNMKKLNENESFNEEGKKLLRTYSQLISKGK